MDNIYDELKIPFPKISSDGNISEFESTITLVHLIYAHNMLIEILKEKDLTN